MSLDHCDEFWDSLLDHFPNDVRVNLLVCMNGNITKPFHFANRKIGPTSWSFFGETPRSLSHQYEPVHGRTLNDNIIIELFARPLRDMLSKEFGKRKNVN